MTKLSDLYESISEYVKESEFTTYSGALQSQIDAKPDTLLDLDDTPLTYEANKYLKSTTSGTEWTTVSGAGGTSFHSELSELDYASAGHTGFASSAALTTHASSSDHDGRYYTETEVDTISGSLSAEIDSDISTHAASADHDGRYYTETELDGGQLDDRYYTETEVDTISGSLQSNIDAKPDTLLELTDTPAAYDDGKLLKSTTSGTEWATVSGAGMNDLVDDTTPQLGGDLDANSHDINMGDQLISRPEIKDYSETKTAPSSSAGTLTLDIVNGNVFAVTLTENVTTLNFNNPSPTGKACSFTLILTQDSTPRTLAWPVSVKWDSGIAPTISTASAIYVLTFVTVDAGTIWYGFLAGSEMA